MHTEIEEKKIYRSYGCASSYPHMVISIMTSILIIVTHPQTAKDGLRLVSS